MVSSRTIRSFQWSQFTTTSSFSYCVSWNIKSTGNLFLLRFTCSLSRLVFRLRAQADACANCGVSSKLMQCFDTNQQSFLQHTFFTYLFPKVTALEEVSPFFGNGYLHSTTATSSAVYIFHFWFVEIFTKAEWLPDSNGKPGEDFVRLPCAGLGMDSRKYCCGK